jgi:hypothetical protein
VNRNGFVRFFNRMGIAIARAEMHKQAPMSSELLEVSLAVIGWLVAFLLGRELANGYVQWRRRRDDADSQRRP